MSKVSTKNIAIAIHESTKDKSGALLDEAIKNIVEYLAQKRLINKAKDILRKLEDIIDEENKITKVNLTFKEIPHKKLIEEIEESLKKRYKSKDIVTEVKEDKKMLGGVKIEVGDEVIDLTLRNKINQLQNYLIR